MHAPFRDVGPFSSLLDCDKSYKLRLVDTSIESILEEKYHI